MSQDDSKTDKLGWRVKLAGFKNLLELKEISGISTSTLRSWFKGKPWLFLAILHYALQCKKPGWTTDRPTKPGDYWCRSAGNVGHHFIMKVVDIHIPMDGYEWVKVEQPPM